MKIELTQDLSFQSCLFYGASRAGKTALCATFPQPVFLCSRREQGFVTIAHMDPAMFFDPKVKPEVFAVDTIADAMQHLHKDIIPMVRAGRCKTIVVELTFHADDVVRSVASDDERNGWAKYMVVEQHVHNVDKLVKQTPGIRVAYNALAAPENTVKETSGVLLPGKALAKKLPALCDVTGYMRQEELDDGKTDRVLHLSAFGNYSPGHRYGNRLPPLVRNPTYKKLAALLRGEAHVDADGNVEFGTPRTVVSVPGKLAPLPK